MVTTVVAVVMAILLNAGSLFAQEGRTTVLVDVPEAQRNVGTYQTPSTTFDNSVSELLIRLKIPTAEYEDPFNEVRVWLYYFDAATSTWKSWTNNQPAAIWKGGRVIDNDTGEVNPDPALSPGLDPFRGKQVRAEFEILRRMRIGCSIETIP